MFVSKNRAAFTKKSDKAHASVLDRIFLEEVMNINVFLEQVEDSSDESSDESSDDDIDLEDLNVTQHFGDSNEIVRSKSDEKEVYIETVETVAAKKVHDVRVVSQEILQFGRTEIFQEALLKIADVNDERLTEILESLDKQDEIFYDTKYRKAEVLRVYDEIRMCD